MHLCYCEMTSGLSELTMGTLQGHPREAPIARQLLELVAVEHAVLRPRHWPLRPQGQRPGGHVVGEAGAFARGFAMTAEAGAGSDADQPHRVGPGPGVRCHRQQAPPFGIEKNGGIDLLRVRIKVRID